MIEQRRARRIGIKQAARVFHVAPSGALGGKFAGEIVDVSSGGLAVKTREHIRQGERLYLEFDLYGAQLVADAIVARQIDASTYGLRFVDLPPIDVARITKYVFTESRRLAEIDDTTAA
jgi:c-di-GMP-binding flagellar brake protein YcgR